MLINTHTSHTYVKGKVGRWTTRTTPDKSYAAMGYVENMRKTRWTY